MLIGLHRKREWPTAPLTRTIGSDDVLLLDSSRPHHWGCLGIGGREVPRPRGICRGARDLSHRSCRLVVSLAWSVIGVEWMLVLWLLSGWNLGVGALACAALNLSYAAWMTVSLLRGLDIPNCGCFGRFFPQPLRWYSPLEDLVLVAMSYALWHCARKPSRLR